MPVVVFYGEESYLLEHAAKTLREATIDPAMASLCHRVYRSPSLAEAIEAIGSVSLALGGETLIEIRDFAWLHQASKDVSTDTQLDTIKSLLETVEDSKTVLFLSTKLDGKIKFPKWLSKHPQFRVEKFEPLKFWETEKAIDFLHYQARQKQINIDPKAVELLVNNLGIDLRSLTNELEKLSLYAYGRPITLNDVMQVSHNSDNLFRLINRWILQEAPDENFRDMTEILARRHAIEVFSTVQSYFNNMFRVIWFQSRGLSLDSIAQRTGQKPFTIRKNLDLFRKVPISRWKTLKNHLTDLEWRAKTGRLEGQLALEVLLGS